MTLPPLLAIPEKTLARVAMMPPFRPGRNSFFLPWRLWHGGLFSQRLADNVREFLRYSASYAPAWVFLWEYSLCIMRPGKKAGKARTRQVLEAA
jgi:hypothetical protein